MLSLPQFAPAMLIWLAVGVFPFQSLPAPKCCCAGRCPHKACGERFALTKKPCCQSAVHCCCGTCGDTTTGCSASVQLSLGYSRCDAAGFCNCKSPVPLKTEPTSLVENGRSCVDGLDLASYLTDSMDHETSVARAIPRHLSPNDDSGSERCILLCRFVL